MPRLNIVVTSTRPGRVGLPVGRWFEGVASAHGGFDIQLVDLAEVRLPLFDEPHHPRLRTYLHDHTRRWSEIVDEADAFVFVVAEYNHAITASFKNALDYLSHEWAYKPAGFVGYGGVAAGTRAVQMAKPILTALKMVPIVEAVSIPFVSSLVDENGALNPTEPMHQGAKSMLDELVTMEAALSPLRLRVS